MKIRNAPSNKPDSKASASGNRRRRNTGLHVGSWCVMLCLLAMLVPSPYVIKSPGPTQDVLGTVDGTEVIALDGVKAHKSRGKLLMVTVSVEGVPGYVVPVSRVIPALADSNQEVVPSEAVFPVGQSAKEYQHESDSQMSGSQDEASKAALAYAKQRGIDVEGAKITLHSKDVGGPSAGMMYALGVLSKLTPRDETGGRVIAGTGTIDEAGTVGKIGGITLKMQGAKRDGATWFIAPAGDCGEVVGHVPQGLRDVKVATLDDAYRALEAIGQGRGESLPHCSASGAGRSSQR